MYLFKNRRPSLRLILSMTVSLIPFFQDKLEEIRRVQECLHPGRKPLKTALRSMDICLGYAFEQAVGLSFAMKSRGYACTKPTAYSRYRIKAPDLLFSFFTLVLCLAVCTTVFSAASSPRFVPDFYFGRINPAGFACYCLLLAMPLILYIFKEIQWLYLKSKI